MKSVFFAVVVTLLTIAQINAYSLYCKYHIVTQKNYSCIDFQYGVPGIRLRINDLTGMNPTINCSNTEKKVIKANTKICVRPDFDTKNTTIRKVKLGKNLTCKDVTNYVGLKANQAYILENFNGNVLRCKNIKKQAGNEIDYCSDKNYKPNFSKSTKIRREEDIKE